MLLEIRDLRVKYGNVEVLHGIHLTIAKGEIVAILGANGAGKSTTLMTISGLVRVVEGIHPLRVHSAAQARGPRRREAG